ncbi:M23 family metallopeptidase [Nonomuraea mesophila]|uniref:M23 family metallopeptidase n=1 Tax=Nonomuraea mesophila TaxID=2530382 RepID=A0A4R5E3M6_9ACTN|nr:M23 family metallopeptidase [Nonomuraea mesophila]
MALVLTATVIAVPAPAAARASPTWRWPLDGHPRVIRRFAPPPEPWLAGHRGVDLAAPPGATVLAAGAGTVRFAGPVGGRGVITVEHTSGLRTTYVPVTSSLTQGQSIAQGAKLGVLESSTDHCQEPCLHWGLLRGARYLDPLLLLGQAPIRLLPFWQASPEHLPHGSPPSPHSAPPPSADSGIAAPPQAHATAIPLSATSRAPVPPGPAVRWSAAPVPAALAAWWATAPVPPTRTTRQTTAPAPPTRTTRHTIPPVPSALATRQAIAPPPPVPVSARRVTAPDPPAALPHSTGVLVVRPVHEARPSNPPAPVLTVSVPAIPAASAIVLSALLGGFLLLSVVTTVRRRLRSRSPSHRHIAPQGRHRKRHRRRGDRDRRPRHG